jgi:hypothetical protein
MAQVTKKTGFFPSGPPAQPIADSKGWVLKVWKGQVLTSYNGQIAENENAPIVFQASVERPNLQAREFGHIHDTWEAAKREGYEMLGRK